MKSRGFTLIELIVFVAIFAVSVAALITVLVTVTGVQTRQAAYSEVTQQGQFLTQQVQYYVQNARVVDMTLDVATSTLVLHEASSSLDPTYITISTGTVYLQQGVSSTPIALTSDKVSVSQISFTRHYNLNSASSPYGTDSVSFSFTINGSSTNGTQYTQTIQSSAAVLTPVGKIALLQEVVAENNNPSVSSLGGTYPINNATGSLLIAVVGNQTAASTSVADTKGNTWTKIASSSYAGISQQVTIFAVSSAKNGSNTVTASFGAGAGYASLYIYEYRGASTSSPVDASSTQIQSNTATPSAGTVAPTSTVELLFAVNSGQSTAVPTPATGYTLQTSSTLGNSTQVYMADANQYITGPVSSTWQFGSAVSTTALILTFK